MTQHTRITFIGGGNMACSLIGGLLIDGFNPDNIRVCDPDETPLQRLKERYAVQCSPFNDGYIENTDCVLFAVKPQYIKEAILQNQAALNQRRPLLISIVAGVKENAIQRWLESDLAIVRCMPNTPAIVQSGATALYANSRVSQAQKNLAESILRAVGLTVWLQEEQQLDAVTALSGSGPAYYFLVMEAMQLAGEKMGLSAEAARLLTLQTAFGAAKMALESDEDAAHLRARVTSKHGTTEAALTQFKEGHFMALFETALKAAQARAAELGELFSK